MKRFAALALVLLTAACTSGPDYQPPEVKIAPNWQSATTLGSARATWWRDLGDPVLDDLVERALKDNLSIEAALARVDQANAAARGAGAALFPTVDANGSLARTQQSLNSGLGQLSRFVPDFPRATNFGSVTVGATWDIDFAGGMKRRRESAQANAVGASAGVQAARVAVVADLTDAYVTLRSTEAQERGIRLLLDTLIARRDIMAVRVRMGTATKSALAGSNAVVADVTATLAPIGALKTAQRARIAVLIGQSPSEPVVGLDQQGRELALPDVPAGLPGDILRQRPDIVAAESALVAANAGIGAALSEYWPRLSLSGLLGVQSNRLGDLFSADSVLLQGSAGLRWRLFDFGRIDAEVQTAKGQTREALAAYRLAILSATADVETGFANLFAQRSRLNALERRRDEIGVQLASVKAAEQVGQISRDARLATEADLALAESFLADARRDVLRAIVACHRALGVPVNPKNRPDVG